jgi:hypothetical protein
MLVCCVCGTPLPPESGNREICSRPECQDTFEQYYSQGPAHSQPRQIEERPSEPGLPLPDEWNAA